MKIKDLKIGERYYYARLGEYPMVFSFVLLDIIERLYYGTKCYYKLLYKYPSNPNSVGFCEIDIFPSTVDMFSRFNKSNKLVLRISDGLFLSKDKGALAKAIKNYYLTRTPTTVKQKNHTRCCNILYDLKKLS